MNNPLLTESDLPFGAPRFDLIRNEHYLPSFRQGLKELKEEVDDIVNDPREPDFGNTIEALEFSGKTFGRVSSIFYNLKEADTCEQMDAIAEEVSPLRTEAAAYVSLNNGLFERVKSVYDRRGSLDLDPVQERLVEKTYKAFVRGGALLSDAGKAELVEIQNELAMLTLAFQKNSLAAANAFRLNITDESELAGLPDYVREMGASAAAGYGQTGWTYDLSLPSYLPFLQYSTRRDLREKLYMAYSTKSVSGEFDNTEICRRIAALRIRMAELLGYGTYAEYAVEERMVGSVANIYKFIDELMEPSLSAAGREMSELKAFAVARGFEGDELMPWDFSFWSEKYRESLYDLSDEQLKPFFRLEKCINAVFSLATRLYGITFEEHSDLPVYHKDVHVYEVRDADGSHLALFYTDFFPRASKRGGAWMTDFRGQSVENGVEKRPFISIVTNFTKPTADAPSLLTHKELVTFLHEFGHSLHGILTRGRYPSMTGTNVDHDFVELPSQIMENWGFEKEFLKSFATDYRTGEPIPDELIEKIKASQNYHAAYFQVRQLQFGILDMAWNDITVLPEEGTVELEADVYRPFNVIPKVPGTCVSTTFSHIFSGGYAAGYYSYKWAEVLAADAFSLFQERGIFNTEVAGSFRRNILSKGSSASEADLYRAFRGHDPEPRALLVKLGIIR